MDNQTLADRLRIVLRRRKLSMKALSEKAGLAPGHVGLIIRGTVKGNVQPDTLRGLARAGEVPYEWLATGEGPIDLVDSPTIDTSIADAPAHNEDAGPLEDEILAAFDRSRHTRDHVDLARAAARQLSRMDREGIALEPLARSLLDAAAAMQRDGELLAPVIDDPREQDRRMRANGERIGKRAFSRLAKANSGVVQSASDKANAHAKALSDALDRGEPLPAAPVPVPKRSRRS